jgi:hypothetical protein
MVSLELARRLRDSGVKWTPSSGDRFVVVDRDMDGEVFVLSNMTVEVHQFPHGEVIGFNGTTEWALDSIDQKESVWLPSETQLRRLLGRTFQRLELVGDDWRVTITVGGQTTSVQHPDADEAYGLALLGLVTGAPVSAATVR